MGRDQAKRGIDIKIWFVANTVGGLGKSQESFPIFTVFPAFKLTQDSYTNISIFRKKIGKKTSKLIFKKISFLFFS